MARYIFITGGVVSSLGKVGLNALGALLQARGYSVRLPESFLSISERRSRHDEPV